MALLLLNYVMQRTPAFTSSLSRDNKIEIIVSQIFYFSKIEVSGQKTNQAKAK